MINSFKNFERLRYRISNDVKKIVDDNKKDNDDIKSQIANTIFATIFSASITEVVFNDIGTEFDFLTIISWIGLFIIVYIISYLIYNVLFGKFASMYKVRKLHSVKNSDLEIAQIQKDFDNIACDSILVAVEYKNKFDAIDSGISSAKLKIFYYYETMHYLNSSCEKTLILLKNKDRCVRTMNEATGVDLFRIINIADIMTELKDFLECNYKSISVDNKQNDSIRFELNKTQKIIDEIKKRL